MIIMEVVEVTSTLILTLKMVQNIIFERTWDAMLIGETDNKLSKHDES